MGHARGGGNAEHWLRGVPRAYAVRVVAAPGHGAWPAATLAVSSAPTADVQVLLSPQTAMQRQQPPVVWPMTTLSPAPTLQSSSAEPSLMSPLYMLHMSPPAWCTGMDEIPVGSELGPLCAQEMHPEQEAVMPQEQFFRDWDHQIRKREPCRIRSCLGPRSSRGHRKGPHCQEDPFRSHDKKRPGHGVRDLDSGRDLGGYNCRGGHT
ncbi:uncharacterized protein LOC144106836 [Amblyomma americanum]